MTGGHHGGYMVDFWGNKNSQASYRQCEMTGSWSTCQACMSVNKKNIEMCVMLLM